MARRPETRSLLLIPDSVVEICEALGLHIALGKTAGEFVEFLYAIRMAGWESHEDVPAPGDLLINAFAFLDFMRVINDYGGI